MRLIGREQRRLVDAALEAPGPLARLIGVVRSPPLCPPSQREGPASQQNLCPELLTKEKAFFHDLFVLLSFAQTTHALKHDDAFSLQVRVDNSFYLSPR